jgi:hypothetical protein
MPPIVMPAHAGIRVFAPDQGVGGRDKPGHDSEDVVSYTKY